MVLLSLLQSEKSDCGGSSVSTPLAPEILSPLIPDLLAVRLARRLVMPKPGLRASLAAWVTTERIARSCGGRQRSVFRLR